MTRLRSFWYWLTLDDPIGTPIYAGIGLAIGLLFWWFVS